MVQLIRFREIPLLQITVHQFSTQVQMAFNPKQRTIKAIQPGWNFVR
jgi:hypothetical protein